MNMPARSPGEPVADRLRLVGRVVVHDDVDLEVGRHVGLDVIQELAELHAAVAPIALSDDLACGDVKGCEERGRAVALVIVSAPLDLPRAQRQQRLGAIEGLNLRFLVHAEDHGMLRRVHVEADDVARLVHEVGVCRELEGLAPVRLKGKGSPDAIDRRRRMAVVVKVGGIVEGDGVGDVEQRALTVEQLPLDGGPVAPEKGADVVKHLAPQRLAVAGQRKKRGGRTVAAPPAAGLACAGGIDHPGDDQRARCALRGP